MARAQPPAATTNGATSGAEAVPKDAWTLSPASANFAALKTTVEAEAGAEAAASAQIGVHDTNIIGSVGNAFPPDRELDSPGEADGIGVPLLPPELWWYGIFRWISRTDWQVALT